MDNLLENESYLERLNELDESEVEDYLKSLDESQAQELLDEVVKEVQDKLLKSDFGKAINNALDYGIKAIFPAIVDDQLINLKDNIYNYGFGEGIKKSFNDMISTGKNILGIANKDFENVSQVKEAVKSGGLIDDVSDLLDDTINNLKSSKVISSKDATKLKKGKNEILDDLEENIEEEFSEQLEYSEKIDKYISNWEEDYMNQDFESMEKEYNKIEAIKENVDLMDDTLEEIKKVENIHELIKNNDGSFDLSDEEIELANKLLQ